jgi:hypothetical protein
MEGHFKVFDVLSGNRAACAHIAGSFPYFILDDWIENTSDPGCELLVKM